MRKLVPPWFKLIGPCYRRRTAASEWLLPGGPGCLPAVSDHIGTLTTGLLTEMILVQVDGGAAEDQVGVDGVDRGLQIAFLLIGIAHRREDARRRSWGICGRCRQSCRRHDSAARRLPRRTKRLAATRAAPICISPWDESRAVLDDEHSLPLISPSRVNSESASTTTATGARSGGYCRGRSSTARGWQKVQMIYANNLHYITKDDYRAALKYVPVPEEFDFHKILNW